MKPESRMKSVAFADGALKRAFDKLKSGKFEDRQMYDYLNNAFDELKENPFAGIKIPGGLWPKIYVQRYGIDNLRKYDLPNGWRLIYTLRGNSVEIVSVILEWFSSHKEYEKRFGYKTG